jgi:hypothetical protein
MALMTEAVRTSATSATSHQSVQRRHNPQDGHLHNHRRENHKARHICKVLKLQADFATELGTEKRHDVSEGPERSRVREASTLHMERDSKEK